MRNNRPRWEMEIRGPMGPNICLPAGYDKEDLQEIAVVGKQWSQFLNMKTGEIVDCEDFYKKYLEEVC